jgi:hypothetical protein
LYIFTLEADGVFIVDAGVIPGPGRTPTGVLGVVVVDAIAVDVQESRTRG